MWMNFWKYISKCSKFTLFEIEWPNLIYGLVAEEIIGAQRLKHNFCYEAL